MLIAMLIACLLHHNITLAILCGYVKIPNSYSYILHIYRKDHHVYETVE